MYAIMQSIPLTYLFTDLEGSTRLWEAYPRTMRAVLERHDHLLRSAVETHAGRIVKTTGDGLHAVFNSASDGVQAALAGQLGLIAEQWPEEVGPLRVRMGLHTGEGQARDGDYYGPAINRAARVMAAGHGGQVLLSDITAALVREELPGGVSLLDLGEHYLRDLAVAEHLYQLCHPDLTFDFPPLKSLSAYKHNLPTQRTSFVGREREMTEIKRLLGPASTESGGGTRLLTLLGPGGTGKTRLMLQVAADLLDQFPDGVWLVELAPLSDPALLAERCAASFNIQEQQGRPILETLTTYLRQKELLLLLDNVEHLVRECARLAEHLLTHCPRIKLLATGRESLFIDGETMLQIPSLTLPAPASKATPETIRDAEAVRLFVARAQAVQSDFALTAQNAGAVADIVRRLDGIPLALELAAARVRIFSAEQIAERLDDRFRLLTGGRRTALPRQQTLQALIDWSWNLLDADEQALLRRLSVFSGGWTLEAAEEVAAFDELDVWDGLDQLVNKSLVIADHARGEDVRYRMLESIRQYAEIKLVDAGESAALRDRHAEYFAAFSETAWKAMTGPDMLIWLERVLAEKENAYAARDWMLESRLDLSVRLAAGGSVLMVVRYWFNGAEARRWLRRLVEMVDAEWVDKESAGYIQNMAIVRILLGTVLFSMGDNRQAADELGHGVSLARQAGMIERTGFALNIQTLSLLNMGLIETATPLAEEALALSRELGHDFLLGVSLGTMSPFLEFRGEPRLAESFMEEAVQLAIALDNPWLKGMLFQLKGRLLKQRADWVSALDWFDASAELFRSVRDFGFRNVCRSEMAHVLRLKGDYVHALQLYRETIRFFQEFGNRRAVAHQLECFAAIDIAQNHFENAAQLLGAAMGIRASEAGNRLPHEETEFEQAMAQLAESMGESAREAAMKRGSLMKLDEAVAFALAGDIEAA